VSWRDVQRLEKTPGIVFSAACSSGWIRIAGLGEQLGLFGALRRRGTRSLVAPRWDIVASEVTPIIDQALAATVRGEPVGAALKRACTDAEEHMPQWLAWSLALEGDWR
jgi:hypothetical protein